jgi:hypothetical protein
LIIDGLAGTRTWIIGDTTIWLRPLQGTVVFRQDAQRDFQNRLRSQGTTSGPGRAEARESLMWHRLIIFLSFAWFPCLQAAEEKAILDVVPSLSELGPTWTTNVIAKEAPCG